jgi:predicted dehydrogenase
MKLGVGIIGLGFAGAQHLEAYLKHPDVEVKMICALDAEKHRRLAEERHLRFTSDYREVLRSKDVEVVSICTPDHLHAEQALAAIQSGKHVFCEKPLAVTLADSQKTVDAVRSSKTKFLTGQILRFAPYFLSLKKLHDAGMLGRVFFAESDYVHDLRPFLQGWRRDPDSGVDLTLSGGCHPVDLLRWIVGEVEEVYAVGNKLCLTDLPFPADNILLVLKFTSGATGKVQITGGCRRPYALNLSLYGTEGTLVNDRWFTERIEGLEDFIALPLAQKAQFQYYDREVVELLEAIREDREPSVTALEGAKTMAVCLAAVESARTNRPVKVAQF